VGNWVRWNDGGAAGRTIFYNIIIGGVYELVKDIANCGEWSFCGGRMKDNSS
jgi:hypothetical protein